MTAALLAAVTILLTTLLDAAAVDRSGLASALAALAAGFRGRVGACVQTGTEQTCVRGSDRFPLQSVMKLMVGFAVLDAVDARGWRLDDPVLVRRDDLSLYVQPIAKLVGAAGYRTTVGDLVRRAVIDSDSAATDILIRRLGGTNVIAEAMRRHDVDGIRVDRDERHLQTEIVGLTWRPEFVDAAVLNRAIQAVPAARRDRAV